MIRKIGFALLALGLASAAVAAPFTVDDKDLHALPADISSAIGQDPGCSLMGKKANIQQSGRDIWFVTSTCGSNDGQPVWLVSTVSKPVIILDAGTFLNLDIKVGSTNGLPDVTTFTVKPLGYYAVSWRFNGSQYREAGSKFVEFSNPESCNANADICKTYGPKR